MPKPKAAIAAMGMAKGVGHSGLAGFSGAQRDAAALAG